MNQPMDLQFKYERLKEEFETYQNFAENTIQMISEKNRKLEKKLDNITNIVEISKYINSNVSEENLLSMINDMIIGVLGATYSSIYVKENNKLTIKVTNINEENSNHEKELYTFLDETKPFVINCKEPIYRDGSNTYRDNKGTHSIVGVPINLRDKLIGYIVVEHTLWNFFSQDHVTFISSIANQIGIALENNSLYKRIREISMTDPLLQIYNRKCFFEKVQEEIHNNRNKSFAIVMIDIDDFKQCNDVHGHQFGDEVLIKTTNIIKNCIDKNDILARYGGEELIIYIKEGEDRREVINKLDRIRLSISNNIVTYGKVSSKVTASFGVSFYPKEGNTLEDVIMASDKCMYKAKSLGKNKVISA